MYRRLSLGLTDGFLPQAAACAVSLSVDAGESGDRVVDPDRIVQVLSNLIENALRYTPEMGFDSHHAER